MSNNNNYLIAVGSVIAVAVIIVIIVLFVSKESFTTDNTSRNNNPRLQSTSKIAKFNADDFTLTIDMKQAIDNYKKMLAVKECLDKAGKTLNRASGYGNNPYSLKELSAIFEKTFNDCMIGYGY